MYHLMTTYGEGAPVDYSKDLTGDDRLDHVMVIFRELRLPFSLNMVHKLRKKERPKKYKSLKSQLSGLFEGLGPL